MKLTLNIRGFSTVIVPDQEYADAVCTPSKCPFYLAASEPDATGPSSYNRRGCPAISLNAAAPDCRTDLSIQRARGRASGPFFALCPYRRPLPSLPTPDIARERTRPKQSPGTTGWTLRGAEGDAAIPPLSPFTDSLTRLDSRERGNPGGAWGRNPLASLPLFCFLIDPCGTICLDDSTAPGDDSNA